MYIEDHSSGECRRLNLGAGSTEIEGFIAVDHKNGQEIYPLDVPDSSLKEIRASHCLEHFSHQEVAEVLKHWVDKLEPGGKLKIAVPDFRWIAEQYLAGVPIPLQGYVMGGQVDADDYHKCAFDADSLHQLMANCGLERIGRWKSEIQDCADLDVSLNLQGFKPHDAEYKQGLVTAVLSAGRFAPTIHMQCAANAFHQLRIPYRIMQGAYWHQVLEQVMEEQLQDAPYFITCDYDSVFSPQDVHELIRLMQAYPEVDALVPLQMKRSEDAVLVSVENENVYKAEFDQNLKKVKTGHFGLTIFRTAAFNGLKRPWFLGVPAKDGSWGTGKLDPDIYFWDTWRQQGRSCYLAPRVVVGHMVELVLWPNHELKAHYQTVADYSREGIPKEVLR